MRSSQKAGVKRVWRHAHAARASANRRPRLTALLTAAMAAAGLLTLASARPGAAQPPPPAPGVTMSAAAQSASAVYLAYATPFRDVIVRNVTASPQTTTALGGTLIGGPSLAVARAGVLRPTSALAVFGRGTDNALWWKHQTASGWTSWQSLGGIITSQPSAIAAPPGVTGEYGALAVFVRGNGGVMWYRSLRQSGWSPWTEFIGNLLPGTGPAAVYESTGNFLAAAVGLAPSKNVWLFRTTEFGQTSGRTPSTPGITFVAGRGDVVFARGLDNALWYEENPPGTLNVSGSWHSLGGRLTSGVTATTVPSGKTYAFALGTDNQIWMRAGTWPALAPWTRL